MLVVVVVEAPRTSLDSVCTAGVTTSKLSTNDSFQLYNPAYTTQFTTSFVQPLLRNRGRDVNRLPITIAAI